MIKLDDYRAFFQSLNELAKLKFFVESVLMDFFHFGFLGGVVYRTAVLLSDDA